MRVLFVGNSYTASHGLPAIVQSLANSRDLAMEQESVAPAGALLVNHLDRGRGKAAWMISSGHFTHVVLQEQSQLPIAAPPVFIDSVRGLATLAASRNAKVVLFVTWSPRDAPQEQAFLTDAYAAAARDAGAILAPVGPAWAAARKALPDLELYAADGSHPAPLGTYLAALVLYGALTGSTPVGLPARLGASAPVAAELQRIAAEALQLPATTG